MPRRFRLAFVFAFALMAGAARADVGTADAFRDLGNELVVFAAAGLGYVAFTFWVFGFARKPNASRPLRALTTALLLPLPVASIGIVVARVGRHFAGGGVGEEHGRALSDTAGRVLRHEGPATMAWLAVALVALLMIRSLWRRRSQASESA